MKNLEALRNNEEFKRVLADSFGGIMYDVANKEKYNTKQILAIWDSLSPCEQESAGGIVRGAIHFIQGN